MTKQILFGLFLMTGNAAWSDMPYSGLQVDATREGSLYSFKASFDTPLTKCAAYNYLTDYEAAKNLPGVIDSLAHRESANKVKVERTADEQVLFFHVRLHSVMEYTEKPFDRIEFIQLTGDSKTFQGNWTIQPNPQGSTLIFQGLWEPDTFIPLFIIDHFTKNGLIDRFSAIARLAEQRKDLISTSCVEETIANIGE
jgi:Polyketide cyclase / dehydrase and lipid transport